MDDRTRSRDELPREPQDLRHRLETLERLEARYRAIFHTASDGIVVSDPETGQVLDANPRAAEMFGYTTDEARGLPLSAVSVEEPPYTHEEAIAWMRQALGGVPVVVEWLCRHRSGRRFWVEVSLRRASVVGQERMIAFVRDISTRKETEAALRSSEERHRLVVENANDAIFVLQDGEVRFHNRRSAEMVGYTAEELRRAPFSELIHPEDRQMVVERHQRRLRGEDFETTYSFRIRKRQGDELWVELNAVRIDWESRPAVLCFIRDITEQKLLEAQLQQAQRMEAIGRLAGGLAHDFNNMMTVVSGYSDILLARLSPQDPLYANLREIKKAGDHASQLTRQLLAFSRRQVLKPRVLDLNLVIRDMDQMLGRLIVEEIQVALALAPGLWRVMADPAQIEQVVMNLVINARDAMPQGGKIEIRTQNVDLDEKAARPYVDALPGPYVQLSIRDTGTGMDEETRSRIFEPFFTTKEKEKGTGLGLATVYGIVRQSEGHVGVESQPGRGTTFRVLLPRVEGEAVRGALPRPSGEPRRGEETLLVVEDDDAVRALIHDILRRQGYAVLQARHGGEALLICERHEGPIRLLVTDVVMPMMNGPELYQRLSPLRPEMDVLYLSGYSDEAIAHHGVLDDPDTAFLQKPFAPEDLLRKVGDLLSREVG